MDRKTFEKENEKRRSLKRQKRGKRFCWHRWKNLKKGEEVEVTTKGTYGISEPETEYLLDVDQCVKCGKVRVQEPTWLHHGGDFDFFVCFSNHF